MKMNKRTSFLFLLIHSLLHICVLGKGSTCPSHPDKSKSWQLEFLYFMVQQKWILDLLHKMSTIYKRQPFSNLVSSHLFYFSQICPASVTTIRLSLVRGTAHLSMTQIAHFMAEKRGKDRRHKKTSRQIFVKNRCKFLPPMCPKKSNT